MANNFVKTKKGQNLEPVVGSTVTVQGDVAVNSTSNQIEYHNGSTVESVTTTTNTQTLTNKSISGSSNTLTNIPSSGLTGTVAIANGGTGQTTQQAALDALAGSTTSAQYLRGNGTHVTMSAIQVSDVPTLNQNTTGTASNITASSNSTLTTLSALSLPGSQVTGNISGNAGNVTGTVAIANGGTGQTAKTAAFDALSPTTTKGDLIVSNGTNNIRLPIGGTFGQALTVDSSTASGLNYVSIPQGVKNYIITNPGIEQGTTAGYSLGNVTLTSNFPSGVPTFGSGASVNLSLVTVISGQLAGNYSLGYTSIAATTAGNFFATDAFTVDLEGQAKVMQFSFFYQYQSGSINFSGTSSNSFGVAIYDVTNSAWIQPAGVFNLVQSSGVGQAKGTFQTSSNGTSYRLVVYNANATGAGPMSIYFDDFFVGPQITAAGAAISDWALTTGFTPSAGFGTVTNSAIYTRRNGDSLEVSGYWTNGTIAGSTISLGLPASIRIDNTKKGTTSNAWTLGSAGVNASGSTSAATPSMFAFYDGSDTANVYFTDSVTTPAFAKVNGTGHVSTGGGFPFYFSIPVAGYSSNTVMSNDTDTRVVAAQYTLSSSTAFNNTTVNFDSKVFDTHAAVTTGAGWAFTAPVSGFYEVSISAILGNGGTGGSNTMALYKNGSIFRTIQGTQPTGTFISGVTLAQCNAGDTLSIHTDSSITMNGAASNGAGAATVSIYRLSGPATIAATESVNARYYNSATSLSGSLATISWTTKDFDSHSAMSSGTYSVPVSGKYQVNSALLATGTIALNNQLIMELQKNSTVVSRTTEFEPATITDAKIQLSDIVSCNAGDTLRIQVSFGATTPSIVSSNFDNYFSISRVGN